MQAESGLNQRIEVITGDITSLTVDVIVNAANSSLLGGGGVDGAIHRAAGPELLEYCRSLNGCPTGEAKLTPGFKLKAHHVLHTVGPVWRGGQNGEAKLLANCYQNCLRLAEENALTSIAFPAISTGVYGYPLVQATQIAVNTVKSWLSEHKQPEKVIFVCFSAAVESAYLQALAD